MFKRFKRFKSRFALVQRRQKLNFHLIYLYIRIIFLKFADKYKTYEKQRNETDGQQIYDERRECR